jgi:hypothetical protein
MTSGLTRFLQNLPDTTREAVPPFLFPFHCVLTEPCPAFDRCTATVSPKPGFKTIQRLIMGPLNPCSRWPSSQIGPICCRLGRMASGGH